MQSLRVEDLVLGTLAVLCLLHVRAIGLPRGVSLAVAGVVLTGLISGLVAGARGTLDPVTAVLYAVRPLEYWIAFPAALLLLRSGGGTWARRTEVGLAVTTLLQSAFAVLQYYFQIPVGFSHAAYTRAAGLTVGPYELGAMSAMLVVVWVARGRWVLASTSVIALAASIARVSILGAAVALAILTIVWMVRQLRGIRRIGWREAFLPYTRSVPRLVVSVLAVGTAGLVLAFTLGLISPPAVITSAEEGAAPAQSAAPVDEPPSAIATPEPTSSETVAPESGPELPSVPSESVSTRLASTSVLGSWAVADGLAASVPHVRTAAEYQNIAYAHINDYVNAGNAAASGAEPSNLVRFFRWHLILDTVDDPIDIALGLGPSFVGPSVDGSYLRFFADGGVLGALAWLTLIVLWIRRSPLWMVCVTTTVLVGTLFIDIVYAERPMVLFWVLLATATAQTATRRRKATHEPARDAVPAT